MRRSRRKARPARAWSDHRGCAQLARVGARGGTGDDARQRGTLDAENGYRFSRKATLQVAYVARQPGTLRVVVESRSTGSGAGSWSKAVEAGLGVVVLGSFARDL